MILKIVKLFFIVSMVIFLSSCREAVKDGSDSGIVNPPTYAPGLRLVEPDYGEIWPPGSTHEIKWDVVENEFKIEILLYRKNEYKKTIAEGIDNNGSFLWSIPHDLPQSHHYRIHIVYYDNPLTKHFISEEFCVIQE